MSHYRQPVITLALVMLASQAAAADFGGIRELFVGPSIAYFHWQESFAGKKILTEQGLMYGVDGTIVLDLLKTERAGSLTLKNKAGFFGGLVYYDGQTQAPSNLPVKTDVIYVGLKDEIAVGWAIPLGNGYLEPFAGVGYRWWVRDLQESTTNNGTSTVKVSGSTEVWESAYTKVGVALSIPLTNDWRFFVEGGVNIPSTTATSVTLPALGTRPFIPSRAGRPLPNSAPGPERFVRHCFMKDTGPGSPPWSRSAIPVVSSSQNLMRILSV